MPTIQCHSSIGKESSVTARLNQKVFIQPGLSFSFLWRRELNISYYVNYVRHSGRDHEVTALDVSRTRKGRNSGAIGNVPQSNRSINY